MCEISKEYPLISIITPSFNQGRFIRETIESVLSQDYPAIEYIIIDGGSSDETLMILQEYGDRITWISEPDDGQADAVNKGVNLAHGEFIGWINSDDIYEPNIFSVVINTFKLHPDANVVYGDAWHISEYGKIIEKYPTERFNYSRLAETCYICQPAVFMSRQFFVDAGLLRKDLNLCMDYEFWIRLGRIGMFHYVPRVFASSRIYQTNKTFSRSDEVFQEVIPMVCGYYGYIPITWVYGYLENRNLKRLSVFSIDKLLITFIRMNRRCLSRALWYLLSLCLPYGIHGFQVPGIIIFAKKAIKQTDIRCFL